MKSVTFLRDRLLHRPTWALALSLFLMACQACSVYAASESPVTSLSGTEVDQAPADAWSMFRGDVKMTGNSAAELPDNLELLWKVDLDDAIGATAAVSGKSVYVGSLSGRFHALSLKSGKVRWTFENKAMDEIKSSPCLTDDLVIYGDSFGVIRALDRRTGTLRWKYETESQAEILSSPTLIDGKVIVGSYDQFLYAFDATTGDLLWSFETDGPIHCSPSLAGGTVAVAGCDGMLRMVSVADGKETGVLEVGGNIASTPAVVGNQLYFGTMSNEVLAVDWQTMAILWRFEHPKRQFPFFSSPAVTKDRVFIAGRDKMLHSIDRKTGEGLWSYRTKARIDSSPVVVGKRVFVGGNDGILRAIDIESGEEAWNYVVADSVEASPAIAQGRLLIGDFKGNLYCFGAKRK
ncbi:Outer membrane protein assembly factor BamB precursor [Planctomycetes bacterium Pan216]|uniref:Outer membrane protein assembly factor BamB n=1 Tax=Kolteria novifilia TaxID=2527975 RepID=A0A518B359_9BACT|nr:Outer membrane protein assembly factor BamB precursor [Planctomycetes bacterium Pan216]